MEMNTSQSESEIMRIIWQGGGTITLGPLLTKLSAIGKSWKSNTVVTFLARLVEKGLLTVEKSGRNNTYIAVLTEAEYREQQMQLFLHKIYEGDVKELIMSLLKQVRLSPHEIEELKAYWEKEKTDNE